MVRWIIIVDLSILPFQVWNFHIWEFIFDKFGLSTNTDVGPKSELPI